MTGFSLHLQISLTKKLHRTRSLQTQIHVRFKTTNFLPKLQEKFRIVFARPNVPLLL